MNKHIKKWKWLTRRRGTKFSFKVSESQGEKGVSDKIHGSPWQILGININLSMEEMLGIHQNL